MDDRGTRYGAISSALAQLRRSPVAASMVFGAESHEFQLHPSLNETAVAAFENLHRIQLPGDYRGFLIHVGDGGAGPYHGVFRLGEIDEGFGYARWQENDFMVGTLSEPFSHTAAWNDLSGRPVFDESRKAEQTYEDAYWESVTEWQDQFYCNSRQANGAIPICHMGCASRVYLVVTGSEAGFVWKDRRADEGGILPERSPSGQRVTFLGWYEQWLRDALAEAGITI